jgi:hypothetical protein
MNDITHYLSPPDPPYGKERRKKIVDWFNEHPDGILAVNCKWRPQTKDDLDLKKLIKSGFLRMVRHPMWSRSRRSYLVRNKE